MTSYDAEHLQPVDFAYESAKLAFQEQFVPINVENISYWIQKRKSIYFKFLRKEKTAAKFCWQWCVNAPAEFRVQVGCTRQITKQKLSRNFEQRDKNYNKRIIRSLMKR